MKVFKLLWLLVLPLFVNSQSTFFKLYPDGTDSDSFKDLVYVSANEYAFITNSIFYRIDNKGNILTNNNLKQGLSTYLESLTVDQAGNFYVAGYMSTSLTDSKMLLYKLNSSGQLLFSIPIINASARTIKVCKAPNNEVFIIYTIPSGSDYHLIIARFDAQGHEVWNKVASNNAPQLFAAHEGLNGTVDIVITTSSDDKTWLLQVDASGNFSQKEISLPKQLNSTNITYDFCPVPGGGYAMAGWIHSPVKFKNSLMYKTDKDGNLQWQKELNIHRDDRIMSITATTDGFLLLADAGFDNDWSNDIAGDLVLLKTDWQGNTQWKKALGSTRKDYATKVLVPDANNILVCGRVSWPGFIVPVAMLFKTDNQGNLTTTLPFQPASPGSFTKVQVSNDAPVQKLTKAIPAEGGTFIAGGNFQDKMDEEVYPYLLKVSETGQAAWQRKITDQPGVLKAVTNTLDGHFIGLAEQDDVFGRVYTLVKFTTHGDTLWTARLGTTIARDLIATTDGGYLLVGGEDHTLSNYDLVVIKTNATGQELWRKTTGLSSHWEIGTRVKETPEHDFIIAGTSILAFDNAGAAYAAKVDKGGNLLWSKTFPKGFAHGQFYDVVITPDGDYLMAGTAGVNYDKRDLLLMRLSKQGDTRWEKTYDLHLLDEGFSLAYLPNDTILLAGTTGEPLAGNLEKFGFLMTLNKDGIKQRVQYLGKQGVQTSVEKIWVQGDEVVLAGNSQDGYGEGYIYFTKAGTIPSTEQPAATGSLTVYPNPAHAKTFLSMKNNYTGPVNIVLYNTIGQQVMALQRTKSSIELKTEVSLTGLSSGMYYFFIQQGSEKSMKRLEILNR